MNQTEVYHEKEAPKNLDYILYTYGVNTGVEKKITKFLKTGFKNNLELRTRTGSDDVANNQVIDVITPSLSIDRRDDIIRPRSGIFFNFYTDFSRGFSGKSDNYILPGSDLRYYLSYYMFTLAIGEKFAWLFPEDKNKISADQLLYLGGTSSMRGYKEDMFLSNKGGEGKGGFLSSVTNVELRIEMPFNFEPVVFFDIGILEDKYEEKNIKKSTGTGLRYITPIGAIGLLYGYKLDKTNYESRERWHFSLGYTF